MFWGKLILLTLHPTNFVDCNYDKVRLVTTIIGRFQRAKADLGFNAEPGGGLEQDREIQRSDEQSLSQNSKYIEATLKLEIATLVHTSIQFKEIIFVFYLFPNTSWKFFELKCYGGFI